MRRLLTIVFSVLLVSSMFAAGAVAADEKRADLEIDQPDYVDEEVEIERTDNATVYHVQGPEHRLRIDANYSNIVDYGTLDGVGTLTADDDDESFVFDPDGQEATTRIYFDVEGATGTERYVADIRVTNVEWSHLPAAEMAEMEDELSTWESMKRQAESIIPGQDPVTTIEDGLRYAQFFDSPLSSLQENIVGVFVMLFWTPGGWVVTGSALLLVVVQLARHYRYRNRTQKQFAELEAMQREKDEAWLQKARNAILQQCDLNDIFPDHIARAMRDYFGRDNWLAFKQYALMRSPTSIKGTWLQMMAQVGYVGRVEFDGTGTVVDARVVRGEVEGTEDRPVPEEEDPSLDSHPGGWTAEVDLSDLSFDDDEDRRIIELIPADDLDESVFDSDEIDPSEVAFPIDNREVSDAQLLDELDPDFPGDFEDREQFARALSNLIQFVANHDHTDSEGYVRREKDLLSFMMEMDATLHDEVDFPPAYVMQKELLYVAEHMDKGERLHERVETAELDGVSSSRQSIQFDDAAIGGD